VADTTERFNLRFGMDLTEAQIKGFMANRRVRTGRDCGKGAGGLKETDAQTKRNPAWVTARQEYYIRGLRDLASRKRTRTVLTR
jgi:hypothetical protein